MGIREKDSQPDKRKISVGFIRPKELQGDTIYVQLEQKKDGQIFAEAISTKEFNHNSRKDNLLTKGITNQFDDRKGHDYISYDSFLRILQKENNAEIIERYREDGLELSKKLTNLEKLVEPFICLLDDLKKYTNYN